MWDLWRRQKLNESTFVRIYIRHWCFCLLPKRIPWITLTEDSRIHFEVSCTLGQPTWSWEEAWLTCKDGAASSRSRSEECWTDLTAVLISVMTILIVTDQSCCRCQLSTTSYSRRSVSVCMISSGCMTSACCLLTRWQLDGRHVLLIIGVDPEF